MTATLYTNSFRPLIILNYKCQTTFQIIYNCTSTLLFINNLLNSPFEPQWTVIFTVFIKHARVNVYKQSLVFLRSKKNV
jgi:hypothetical protein